VALSRSTRALVVALVVALVGGVAAIVTLPGTPAPPSAASVSRGSPSPSPSPEPVALHVTLRRLLGRGPNGVVKPRHLRRPAAAVRSTFARLYETAFVDPSRWGEGRFPGLPRFFARDARGGVRRDLDRLSLGRLARRLDAVRPTRAALWITFVTGRGGHPVAAFARMEFRARGDAAGVEVPISQSGRFVLRRGSGGWRIDSWNVSARIPSSASVNAKLARARFAPGPSRGRPLFVLVIGSDARAKEAVAATRGDSLHIVSVNPRLGRGAIVGIPRDSWVPIPGHGTSKINAALFFGGPELVVRTVEQLTGIRIDAYLLTGFDGFRRAMDAIGGVKLRVPYAMNDAASGAHFRRGRRHLNGRQALSFSRDRHDVPGGDLGRSLNQGRVLLATLERLRGQFERDPIGLSSWLVGALKFVKTDLSPSQMTELLLAATTFRPGRVRNVVAWGSGSTAAGQSIVRLGSSAYGIFRDVRRDGVLGR
jgi:LCP family protein required for cell wall assembly